ncbi:MAG: hypothetical protein QXF12_01215 [Candidatus Aenigmatarchaeota archaeon]
MSIKNITIRGDLTYKKTITLYLNKLPQSISNKFGVKVNNFTYYSKLVQHIKSTKNYKKPTILLENNPKYRIKTSGEKFIFLGNHGYAKRLDLMFGFDCYTYTNSLLSSLYNSGFIFYFQVIVLNSQSELIFVINYNKSYDELFEAYLEYDSHKEVLLNGITEKNDNSINIKTYFENYKRLVKETLYNTENKIYEYQFGYKNVLEDDKSYQSAFCIQSKKTKKLFYAHSQESVLKPPLSAALKLFYTREYSVIIRQKICTSFISIKENLYNIDINDQARPVPTLSYENKKIYIINNERSLAIADKIPTEYKKEIQRLNFEQALKQLIQININVLTKTKEVFDDYILENDKNGNYFIYNKKQITEGKTTYIVQNVYAYIFSGNKKVTVYDNKSGIKNTFTNFILLANINAKHNPNEKEKKINNNWDIILYNNNYYLINLHSRFVLYLLDFNTLDKLDTFVQKTISSNMLSYLFFSSPIETTLRIIQTNENRELLVHELPNISETILKIDDGNQEYYVFTIKLYRYTAKLSDFKARETSSSYRVYYHIDEKKSTISKFELIFMADDDDNYFDGVFNFFSRFPKHVDVYFTFSIKKEKWEKIKCENLPLIEIIGDFYFREEYYNHSKFHFIAYDGDGREVMPIRLVLRDKDGQTNVIE